MSKATDSVMLLETAQENKQVITEVALDDARLALEKAQLENERLYESISRLDLYLDQQGWSPLNYNSYGPTLIQVQNSSRRCRDMLAMNTWTKRGLNLRTAYIWQGGIHYDNIPSSTDGRSKAVNVQERIDNPINQKYFFGTQAREEREAALYTDGQVFYIGNDEDYTLRTLPIWEITETYRNPDFDSEIWAYRRSWTHFPQGSRTPQTKSRWYFVHEFWDKRVEQISYNGALETVSKTERIFTASVNSQSDWPWGLPDAIAGMAWAEKYTRALQAGLKQQEAMAQIWAQAKANSQAGAQDMAMKIASGGAGGVAITGQNGGITPLSSAGTGYDFDSLRPIIASFAAGVNVSVVALTSDPGAAGSSYGSAQTLEKPESLTASARRAYHVALDKQVLVWMGAPKPEVWFDPILDSTELFREIQGLMFLWNTGLYEAPEMKQMLEGLLGRFAESFEVPDGVLLPNNKDSLPRKDIDTDSGASPAGAPGQGQNSPAGGAGSTLANDTRSDTVA